MFFKATRVAIARFLSLLSFLTVSFAAAGCSGIHRSPAVEDPGADASIAGPADGNTAPDAASLDVPAIRGLDSGGPSCGDGVVEVALMEACDDGNARAGDGCAGDCKAIEKDFACATPGAACVYLVKCGDGILGGNEQCDPPNVGNGCGAGCRFEAGYVCSPPGTTANPGQPATCHRTTCGDGTREGSEACDDGNIVDGDGCAGSCALEPDCASGTCASRCGDAIKLSPEACDDGNSRDGDGCGHDCTVERGFSCTDVTTNPPPQLNLLVAYRDFISFPLPGATQHPDFETFAGMGITPLLVKTALDPAGKPVMDGRCAVAGVSALCPFGRQLTSQAAFNDWYHDTPGTNVAVRGTLLLSRLADGSYVFDSAHQGFYPIDSKGWTAPPAMEAVHMADAVINDGRDHDFGFTTEIHYFFQYRGGESLTFSGDDDVWIFVNGKLALDLGGLHTVLQKTLTVDQSAAALGLVRGGLYEIALFHAERHSAGSNFKLTLTGFSPTSSTCRSACGDGMLASTEQCDDGNNVDGDGCSHDCYHEIVIM